MILNYNSELNLYVNKLCTLLFSILLISGSVFSQEIADQGQQDLQKLNDNF